MKDEKAHEIYNRLNYDFSKFDEIFGEMQVIAWCVRCKNLDIVIRKYMKKHSKATVISLGSGLETAFYRLDNGKITWYDLELPEVIELRRKLLPEIDRNIYIAKSVFDFSWFDDIKTSRANGNFFVANGVLMYFEEEQIKHLFSALAIRFPEA